MEKEKLYNEAVEGDEGFSAGDGYPSCEGQPCANVADDTNGGADTLSVDAVPEQNEAEARVAEWQDKFLRLQAEFDNYRKRTLREKMELVATGGRDVLLGGLRAPSRRWKRATISKRCGPA